MKIFLYFLFFLSYTVYSQSIEIGEVKTIQSNILDEERAYWVYLPDHYLDEKYQDQHYPVIYLLDGERYFHVVTGIVKTLSNGYYPQMPECIVIAIKNTNRSRDLTPTTDPKLTYETGGSHLFESFIENELIPTVNKTYRTLNYKILVGHSFGGLFVLNTLVNSPTLFNGYLAIDPSLWWDDKLFIKQTDSIITHVDFNKRKLFLANANSLGSQKNPSKQHMAHYKAKKTVLKKFKNSPPKHLRFSSKFYKNEDHGSVVLPSMIDGLRNLFHGFRINIKELIKNPSILQEKYNILSKELHYNFIPQSFYLDSVVELAIKRGKKENARILHAINARNYPNNLYLKTKFNTKRSKLSGS